MNRQVLWVIPAILAMSILIFVLLQSTSRPVVNDPPNKPTALSQCKSDGVTVISEGGTITGDTVIFNGKLSDPDGDDVKLEIELRRTGEPFSGEPTVGTGSDLVASGTEVTVGCHGLVESGYNWKCRARDSEGAASDWVEFGDNSGVDFVVSNSDAYLVVRGIDNCTYYRSWSKGFWDDWTGLLGATRDSPAAAILGNSLHIVVNGIDGNIYHGWVNLSDNVWSGWSLLSGATQSSPTLTSNGTALCLLVRGLDDATYYCFYKDDSWGPWLAVPMGGTCDSPAAALLGNDLHIVVRGIDGDSIWHTKVSSDGSGSPVWTLISGATPSRPVLAASQNFQKLCLIVRGADDRVLCANYSVSEESWGDWVGFSEGNTLDGPAATIIDDGLQIVVLGMDGNSLWHCDVDLSSGTSSPWASIAGSTSSAPTLANVH